MPTDLVSPPSSLNTASSDMMGQEHGGQGRTARAGSTDPSKEAIEPMDTEQVDDEDEPHDDASEPRRMLPKRAVPHTPMQLHHRSPMLNSDHNDGDVSGPLLDR